MNNLKPFLVTAPLNITNANDVDVNSIFIFDYENSFKDENNKPDKLITYLEHLGSMMDIFVSPNIKYEEKEQLILKYFNSGSFFNVYTLTQTLIHILFTFKEIEYKGNKSILTDSECIKFIKKNEDFLNIITELYDSLFIIMLYYSSDMNKDIKNIRNKFSEERFNNEELSPNLLNVLLDKEFYNYYDKHIGKKINYYTFLFDNLLYKNMSFMDVLTNTNNILLPLLIDLNNKDFQKFIEENKK